MDTQSLRVGGDLRSQTAPDKNPKPLPVKSACKESSSYFGLHLLLMALVKSKKIAFILICLFLVADSIHAQSTVPVSGVIISQSGDHLAEFQ